jgi:hypothetical protein
MHACKATTLSSATPPTQRRGPTVNVCYRSGFDMVSFVLTDIFAIQAGSLDESSDNFVLPMLDSVVVQVWRAVFASLAAVWLAV